MPKECHEIYDTLKLMEKQEENTKKVEAKADKEETKLKDKDNSNSINADTSKKDQLLDISA
nr:hypothetical protein [Campylobacter aviculae]